MRLSCAGALDFRRGKDLGPEWKDGLDGLDRCCFLLDSASEPVSDFKAGPLSGLLFGGDDTLSDFMFDRGSNLPHSNAIINGIP